MRRFALIIARLAGPVAAKGWPPVHGVEMRDALEALKGRKLQNASARQEFRRSRRTLYTAGRGSWMYWRIEGDRPCSQWLPQDLWACYRVERQSNRLRFVGEGDDITESTYAD